MIRSQRPHHSVTTVTGSGNRNHGMSFLLCRTLRTTRWIMSAIETGVRLALKNILLLPDFSELSELAVPFAIAMVREHWSEVCALHVVAPGSLARARRAAAPAASSG